MPALSGEREGGKMKLIKAVGLIDDLAAAVARDELSGLSFSVVKRYIMRQDAVDAVEVVHGMWIELDRFLVDVVYRCSACGEDFVIVEGTPAENSWNYCPNCGAKMGGERREP